MPLPEPWAGDAGFRFCGEILGPDPEVTFACPASGRTVRWAAKDVFNPGAVVRNGRIHLLVRAEDDVGPFGGTSRIGVAWSDDGGRTFTLRPEPVLYPDQGPWSAWEWPGGCEDPRVVESPDGTYVCCYSAFDGKASCLMIATSDDLVHWEKHGPAFAGTPYGGRWTKSGAIVTAVTDGRLRAARVGGKFQMYWGEGTCFLATSDDLIRWSPVEFGPDDDRYVTRAARSSVGSLRVHRVPGRRALRPVLSPRRGRFDALLTEPGPPALLREGGIVLLYNGASLRRSEDGEVTGVAYDVGHAVFDPFEPGSAVARCLHADTLPGLGSQRGQVDDVCFAQGLVLDEGRWLLYAGLADSRVGYATAPSAEAS